MTCRLSQLTDGRYIGAKQEDPSKGCGRPIHQAKLCQSESDVKIFFGHDDLAKELYQAAKLEDFEDLPADENEDGETIVLQRDGESDLRFTGICLRRVTSDDDEVNAGGKYDWTTYAVYKTDAASWSVLLSTVSAASVCGTQGKRLKFF